MSPFLMPALAGLGLLASPAQAQTLPAPAAPAETATPDHSRMDHSRMDHSRMDHAAMDHAPMDDAAMDHTQMDHSGMDHSGMDHSAPAHGKSHAGAMAAMASGTGRLPAAEPHGPAFHLMAGDWMVMLHGIASAQYTAASGPRGRDKLYATSMLMATASHDTAWGRVQLRTMLSHEPLMARDGYPNLFASGETAYGRPLVDRQHPHDLFMELSARVDVTVAPGTSLFIYGGPVGEPALGPSVFMMRGSAIYNPEPPIAHHWFDSTHITYGVVTAGVASRHVQLEASAFRGREPDERRWNIETGKLDSWSVRATLTPTPRWAIQASYGRIKQPEVTHPGEDERRFTASASYAAGDRLSAMLAFSAKQRVPGETLTAVLGEATWRIDPRNALFGRVENVANDELFPDHAPGDHEHAERITKLQAGYARLIPTGLGELALGGNLATFAKPVSLSAAYGTTPVQATLFARIRFGR